MNFEKIHQKVKIFVKLKRHESAEKLIRFYISEKGELPELYNLLGVVFMDVSDHENAIESFQKALAIDPKFQESRINLTILLCDTGYYAESLELLKRGNKDLFVNKRLAKSHLKTAIKYQENHMLADAVQELKKTIKLDPDNNEAKVVLSRIFYQREQWNHCSSELESLIKSGVDSPEIRRLLGLSYQNMGRIEDAKAMNLLSV